MFWKHFWFWASALLSTHCEILGCYVTSKLQCLHHCNREIAPDYLLNSFPLSWSCDMLLRFWVNTHSYFLSSEGVASAVQGRRHWVPCTQATQDIRKVRFQLNWRCWRFRRPLHPAAHLMLIICRGGEHMVFLWQHKILVLRIACKYMNQITMQSFI